MNVDFKRHDIRGVRRLLGIAVPTMSVSPASAEIEPTPSGLLAEKKRKPEAYTKLCRRLTSISFCVILLSVLISPIHAHDWLGIILLTGLAVGVGFVPVRLPGRDIVTSPSIPILFALAGLYGATAAIFAAIISLFAMGFISMPPKWRYRLPLYIPALSSAIASLGVASLLYVILEKWRFPHSGFHHGQTPEWRACLALLVCSLIDFLASAIITTNLTSSYYQKRRDIIWHDNFLWMLPSALLMAPVSFLAAALYEQYWWLGVGFLVVPVYAMRAAVVTHERMLKAYKEGVELLGQIMQEAHPYTHGHLHRVAHWAKMIAEQMQLPPNSMQHIEDAAILHDIGKVAVDDRVLNKVGKLSDNDWEMIRRHPVTGADLVMRMSILGKVAHWIRHHHERPDGKGYPDQLKGDEIPVESCIISVVDAYDAMVGGPAKEDQRPYRQPMTEEAAIAELRRHSGTQFHAEVVEVFIEILERERNLVASGEKVKLKPGLASDSLWATPPELIESLSLSRGS